MSLIQRSRNTSTKEGAAWLLRVVLPFTSHLLCGAAFLPLSLGWCCFLPVGCCCRWLPPPLGYGGAALSTSLFGAECCFPLLLWGDALLLAAFRLLGRPRD